MQVFSYTLKQKLFTSYPWTGPQYSGRETDVTGGQEGLWSVGDIKKQTYLNPWTNLNFYAREMPNFYLV